MSDFRVKPTNGVKLGPEANPWFWAPSRVGVRQGPEWFAQKLTELAGELTVTWNAYTERWQVWSRCERLQTPLAQGWNLLFIHKDLDGSYLPLDERVLARLWSCSADNVGNGKAYAARIAAEFERDEARKQRRLHDEAIDAAMPWYDYSQIKVAMHGHSNGSKSADYLT